MSIQLPTEKQRAVEPDGRFSVWWRKLFQAVVDNLQGQIDGLAAALEAITALGTDVASTVAALASKADKTTEVRAIGSIDGGGTLDETLITFSLDNDEDAPGNNYVYGTDGSGDKGWIALASVSVGDAATLNGQAGSHYLSRANHTGTQIATTISDFTEAAQDAVGAMVDSSLVYTDGTPLLQRAALTGDVTASAGSNATTIANDAVSNAKLANMAAGAIKARKTASTGDPEDCTLTEVINANIASVAQGDVLYYDGTVWARLGAGTSGHFLKTQGTGANPVWAAASGSGGAMTLVGTATVTGSAATTLTLSGLDLAADGMYFIEFSLKNNNGSAVNVRLYYNSDTTATNYYRQVMDVSNSTFAGFRQNDGYITSIAASEVGVGFIHVAPDLNGRPRATLVTTFNTPSSVGLQVSGHVRNNTANVTSATLSGDVATSLAVGSYIKFWKLS